MFNKSILFSAILLALSALNGCGGGGGGGNNAGNSSDGSPLPENPPYSEDSSTVTITARVIDGYIESAEVCADLNNNSLCDENEPKGNTNASGLVSLKINKSDLVGKQYFELLSFMNPKCNEYVLDRKIQVDRDVVMGKMVFINDVANIPLQQVTPYTTLASLLMSNYSSYSESLYDDIISDIAQKTGLKKSAILGDYNNPNNFDEDSKNALITSQYMVRNNVIFATSYLGYKNHKKLIQTSIQDLDYLKYDIEHCNPAKNEKIKGMMDKVSTELSYSNISTLVSMIESVSYEANSARDSIQTLTSGIAEDWRCGITGWKEVYCWGNNSWGNLGNPYYVQKTTDKSGNPVTEGIEAAGNYSASALRVYTKKDGKYEPLANVESVVAGNRHACAVTTDGNVYCWGANYEGQLGQGNVSTENLYYNYAVPVVKGQQQGVGKYLSNIKQVSLGLNYSCALDKFGDVWCWGNNSVQQLGDSHPELEQKYYNEGVKTPQGYSLYEFLKNIPYPVKVEFPQSVKSAEKIFSGYWSNCATVTNINPSDTKNLYCWGGAMSEVLGGYDGMKADEKIVESSEWNGRTTPGNVHTRKSAEPVTITTSNYSSWYVHNTQGDWYPLLGKSVTLMDNQFKCSFISFIDDSTCDTSEFFTDVSEVHFHEWDSELFFRKNNSSAIYSTTKNVLTIHDEKLPHADLNIADIDTLYIQPEDTVSLFLDKEYNTWFYAEIAGYDLAMNQAKNHDVKKGGKLSLGGSDRVLSLNTHSACLVSAGAVTPTITEVYCWGSQLFGQTGTSNSDLSSFSYQDAVNAWDGSWGNIYYDKENRSSKNISLFWFKSESSK